MKKLYIVLLLAFALVFVLGCQLVTGVPTQEAVSVPAEPVQQEPAPAPTQASVANTPVPTTPPVVQANGTIYESNFSDIDNWVLDTKNAESTYDAEIRGGGLFVEVPDEYDFWYAYAPMDVAYEDVRVEADVKLSGGTNYTYITLTCRASAQGTYVFYMDTGGFWQIGKWIFGDTASYERLGEGGSTKIKVAKHPNTITAVCEGNTLTMLINGGEVGSVEDSDLTNGVAGIGVETFDYPLAQVMFYNLKVTSP